MQAIYDHSAPKKPTNLSLNSDLLKRARELGINLSSELEGALEDIVKRHLSQQWLNENREAIASYNQHIESNGVFSDDLRSF